MPKRVLIVDDEPKVAIVLASSLRKMAKDFVVETANSGKEALAKVAQNKPMLVLTDYKMPHMGGLELAQQLRVASPQTQIVLMTAYGTEELRQQLESIGVSGYIEKPFKVHQLRQIVQQALSKFRKPGATGQAASTPKAAPEADDEPQPDKKSIEASMQHALQKLQRNANAICVLLLNASGYPIEAAGHTDQLDIHSMGALSAANCSVFKSNYHEGEEFNVYSYDVNGELFLAVFFGVHSKPGIVWFYTKQTAEILSPIAHHLAVDEAEAAELNEEIDVDFVDALSGAMDTAFIDRVEQEPKQLSGGAGVSVPSEAQAAPAAEMDASSMTFEQAMAAGLVPQHILAREEDDPDQTS